MPKSSPKPSAPAKVIPFPDPFPDPLPVPSPVTRALIDEYGDLDERWRLSAPWRARREKVADLIRAAYKDRPADTGYSAGGARFTLHVSAAGDERKIDARALYRALGLAKFLRAVKTTITGAAAFLAVGELEVLITAARTGPRTLTATPATPVPAERAA